MGKMCKLLNFERNMAKCNGLIVASKKIRKTARNVISLNGWKRPYSRGKNEHMKTEDIEKEKRTLNTKLLLQQ